MEQKPSEQWKDYLHEKKSLDKAADESFDLYIKKYSKEDTAHNPRKEKITEKFFTPGKIYSFLYVTSDRPNPSRPVIDRRPVIISLGQMVSPANNKVYEIGIDLMLVPPKVRVFILNFAAIPAIRIVIIATKINALPLNTFTNQYSKFKG